jgi:hypothetical protein
VSVISSFTVTPNRVEIIARYLQSHAERGMARDDLLAQLSPESLQRRGTSEGNEISEGRSSVPPIEALDETLRLGIAERFDKDGADWVRFVGSPERESLSLLERLESVLLDADMAADHGQREFRRALAWFLTQNPEHPIDARQNVRSAIEEQCGYEVNAFELTNKERSRNFLYWVRYLGYGWYVGQKSSVQNETLTVVVPDPTEALARHLPRLMTPGQTLPLAQMVASWGGLSPVLEGGSAREEVEALLRPALRRSSGTLSRSTSLALQRLDQRFVIHLERQADAPAVMLDIWPDPLPISHVTYLRTA